MNPIIEREQSGCVKPIYIADWLISHGISAISSEEAAFLLGIDKDRVRQHLAPSRRRGAIVSPARGLWVPVPPEDRAKGAPEPLGYIDAMMQHLGSEYLVGWLTAASLHGASHQASQTFQVATSKHIADRSIGDTKLAFRARDHVRSIPGKKLTRSAGTALVSDPGPTMLMVAEDILDVGGLDNAATVILEVAHENPHALDSLEDYHELFSTSAIRRVGWVLDEFGGSIPSDTLLEISNDRGDAASVLSPHAPRTGQVNKRWNILLNREVEPDL